MGNIYADPMADVSHELQSPLTLFERIWRQHRIAEEANGTAVLAVDRIFLHERTGSVALKSLRERGYPIPCFLYDGPYCGYPRRTR